MAQSRFFVRVFDGKNGCSTDFELSANSVLNAIQSLYEINPAVLTSLDSEQLANIEMAKRELETIGQEVWRLHYQDTFQSNT